MVSSVSKRAGGDSDTPRAVALVFARALQQVDRIQSAALRAPIVAMLEAGIEECVVADTLLGHRLNYLRDLAWALVHADLEASDA